MAVMGSPRSRLTVSAALLLVTFAVAKAPAQPTGAPVTANANPADNLPNRPGKDQVILSCSGCHQPDIVIGQKRDATAWRELVDQMIARGANVDEAKYEEIITYLAQAN